MTTQMELTLGELARIALGTSDFGPNNLAVLQSLIDLLLKKLDCRDEIVKVGGYETDCLKKMLKDSRISPFSFREDQVVVLSEKFQRIAELEKRVESIQDRLKTHFEEIEQCNKADSDGMFSVRNWEHYAAMCEDLCVVCEPENVGACQLIQNADFMKKMLRRIAFPLVNRVLKFEKRIEVLHDDFRTFIETTKQHYLKMSLVERCVQEIEHVRHEVEAHHSKFLGIMEEVQDMFDSKLDKIHLPALKKYCRDRFDAIGQILDIERKKQAPKLDDVIVDGIKCLSCGNERVRVDKFVHLKGFMPEAHTRMRTKILKKYCKCPAQEQKLTQLELPSRCVRIATAKPLGTSGVSCPENEYVLKEGTNHVFYRMAAKEQKEAEGGIVICERGESDEDVSFISCSCSSKSGLDITK